MAKPTLIRLSEHRPEQALEALNRITGVRWQGLPRSLLSEVQKAAAARAMNTEPKQKKAG